MKIDAPHGVPLHLKMKPKSETQPPPPLKRETPFHEMIPKKAQ